MKSQQNSASSVATAESAQIRTQANYTRPCHHCNGSGLIPSGRVDYVELEGGGTADVEDPDYCPHCEQGEVAA